MAQLKLFLLGHPVSQSRSPAMQNAALESLGIAARYETLDVPPETLLETLETLDADPSVLGCNVTVPHKVSVHAWLLERGRILNPRARIAGAVNTLWRGPDGRFHGDSTDFDGAMDAILREAYQGDLQKFLDDLPRRDVAILGSGGSALSIATNLVHPWEGARADSTRLVGPRPRSITIFARNPSKARALAEASTRTSDLVVEAEPLEHFPSWNRGRNCVVIQTTTLGMESGPEPGASPVPPSSLEPGQIAFDLVYKPHRTPFLAHAEQGGARVVHGIGMLVGQGARSLEIWCQASSLASGFDRGAVVRCMAQALEDPTPGRSIPADA